MSSWEPRQSNAVVTAWKAGKGQPGKGWDVDASSFFREIEKLELKVQRKNMNTILKRTGKDVYIPALKRAVPNWNSTHGTRARLKKSMGSKTARQRYLSAVYVGPRVPFQWGSKSDEEHKALPYSGRIANVFDYTKGRIKKGRTRFRQVMWAARHRAEANTFAEVRKLIMTR